jgi:hypothetical protein
MNVEPCSYTRFSGHGSRHPFRTLQVVLGRYFEVVLIARDKRDGKARMFGNGRVVGHLLSRCGSVGGQDLGKPESLRCLGAPHILTIDGRGHNRWRAGAAFERIRDRDSRQNCRGGIKRYYDPIDCRMIDKRTGGIVNKDVIGVAVFERLKTASTGLLAGRTASDGTGNIQTGEGVGAEIAVLGANDDLHGVDSGMRQESLDRASNNRGAANRQILFWNTGSDAGARSSGKN